MLTAAKNEYETQMLGEMHIKTVSKALFLNNLYKENYEGINKTLGEPGVMDSLWEKYTADFGKRKAVNPVKLLAKKMSLNNTDPEITGCAIPGIFASYWIDWHYLPNPELMGFMQLMNEMDPSISGCKRSALAKMGLALYTMRNAINPDQAYCDSYNSQIEGFVMEYVDCPAVNEHGIPSDPYPPGSGGIGWGPGGGGDPEGNGPTPCDMAAESLNAFILPNESFQTCVPIPINSPSYSSISDLRTDLTEQTHGYEFITDTDNEKIVTFKAWSLVLSRVDILVKLKKNTAGIWEVDEVTSALSLNTFANAWSQLSYTVNVNNNVIRVNLHGQRHFTFYLQDIGNIYSTLREFEMTIDNTNCKPLSFKLIG